MIQTTASESVTPLDISNNQVCQGTKATQYPIHYSDQRIITLFYQFHHQKTLLIHITDLGETTIVVKMCLLYRSLPYLMTFIDEFYHKNMDALLDDVVLKRDLPKLDAIS